MSRQVKTLAMGAALSLVAAAFSYALPGVVFTSNLDPVLQEELEDPDPTPSPSPTEEEEEEGEEEEEEEGEAGAQGHKDNHGAAVSTAAKCPVKGRAHGELVRSIARDKEATVADAETACDDAVASQEEGGDPSTLGGRRSQAVKPKMGRSSKSSSTGSASSEDESSKQSAGGSKGGPKKPPKGKGSGQGKGRP